MPNRIAMSDGNVTITNLLKQDKPNSISLTKTLALIFVGTN